MKKIKINERGGGESKFSHRNPAGRIAQKPLHNEHHRLFYHQKQP